TRSYISGAGVALSENVKNTPNIVSNNRIQGLARTFDSRNCIVKSDKGLIVLVGLDGIKVQRRKNMIVVEPMTKDEKTGLMLSVRENINVKDLLALNYQHGEVTTKDRRKKGKYDKQNIIRSAMESLRKLALDFNVLEYRQEAVNCFKSYEELIRSIQRVETGALPYTLQQELVLTSLELKLFDAFDFNFDMYLKGAEYPLDVQVELHLMYAAGSLTIFEGKLKEVFKKINPKGKDRVINKKLKEVTAVIHSLYLRPSIYEAVPVPESKRSWKISWSNYKPREFTAEIVRKDPHATPDDKLDFKHTLKTRTLGGTIKFRELYGKKYPIFVHPTKGGRTGIWGRGLLPFWGPNPSVDIAVTGDDPITGKPIILVVERKETPHVGLPGKRLLPHQDIFEVISEQLLIKTGIHLSTDIIRTHAKVIYEGYSGDFRNTDNAWVETTVLHIHLDSDLMHNLMLQKLEVPEASQTFVKDVKWAPLNQKTLRQGFYASHAEFAEIAKENIKMQKATKPLAVTPVAHTTVLRQIIGLLFLGVLCFNASAVEGFAKIINECYSKQVAYLKDKTRGPPGVAYVKALFYPIASWDFAKGQIVWSEAIKPETLSSVTRNSIILHEKQHGKANASEGQALKAQAYTFDLLIDKENLKSSVKGLEKVNPKKIGIDEIASQKGHNYLTIVRLQLEYY
ncbi:MAG: hypothetical protein WCH62_07855, partial [Candidatus Omnitrophota bacterium]